jgi:hypothetical protein
MSEIRRFDFDTRIHRGVIHSGVRDFDEVNKGWDVWAPKAHAPARSSGQARMAKPGIVTAAA